MGSSRRDCLAAVRQQQPPDLHGRDRRTEQKALHLGTAEDVEQIALLFGFDSMIAVGWHENVLQILAQGILSGPLATYFSARAARVLGTGRGATFSALVPGFTMLIGVLALGEWPTVIQLCGLGVVALGFRLVMKR